MPEACERQWFDNCPLFSNILLLVIMPQIPLILQVCRGRIGRPFWPPDPAPFLLDNLSYIASQMLGHVR